MKPSAHVAISASAAAAAYGMTGSGTIGFSLFLGGVFIDLDHVSDYVLMAREKFSISNFFAWFYEHKWTKIYLPLHSYELIAVLIAAAAWLGNDWLIGLSAGFAIHLISDQIGNRRQPYGTKMVPLFYFLSYRFTAGFLKANLLAPDPDRARTDRLRVKLS